MSAVGVGKHPNPHTAAVQGHGIPGKGFRAQGFLTGRDTAKAIFHELYAADENAGLVVVIHCTHLCSHVNLSSTCKTKRCTCRPLFVELFQRVVKDKVCLSVLLLFTKILDHHSCRLGAVLQRLPNHYFMV